ncbi:MAG: phosphoglycerate mutase family protein [Anaerolineales bacterium]|nr:phosphoglycerate mutase family protein [Anaerolineales bacterium]
MVKVWFIRHGESEANAGLSTSTPSAVQLTDTGWEQARKVSLAFVQKPSLIVTSKYSRTMQTAQPTIERFPSTPVETWDIHEFTYLSPKKLGDTSKEDRQPLVKSFWTNCDPNYLHGTDAETFSAFLDRVEALKNKIIALEEGSVVIFSHGFVIKAILWANLVNSFAATPEYMKNFHTFHKSFNLSNGAIIECQSNSKNLFFSGIITNHLND